MRKSSWIAVMSYSLELFERVWTCWGLCAGHVYRVSSCTAWHLCLHGSLHCLVWMLLRWYASLSELLRCCIRTVWTCWWLFQHRGAWWSRSICILYSHVEDINSYTFYSDDVDGSFYIGDDLLEGTIIAADICCTGCSWKCRVGEVCKFACVAHWALLYFFCEASDEFVVLICF